jgi:WD40 repeat protein
VWDASSGQELQTLSGHPGEVWDFAWSADGSRLLTASDGSIRFYLLRLEDLVTLARRRVTRSLSIEECQDYLHLPEEQCQERAKQRY